jgi:predicted dithiol-disulfide oxidoreductase (DUF899 family)
MTRTEQAPAVVDYDTWQAEIEALRVREKAHTHAGDALAAARRRLPMVEVDATVPLMGANGRVTLLDAFDGRQQLIGYYHMWHDGHGAANQCEGCTFFTSQIRELSYLHSRDVTYAVLCQGPYEPSVRYREFMNLDVPWYSAQDSLDVLMRGRPTAPSPVSFYVREGSRVFETYWTSGRGLEPFTPTHGLLDRTLFGRREAWEDIPEGWPRPLWSQGVWRTNGRPIAQWSRIAAGRSDDLET